MGRHVFHVMSVILVRGDYDSPPSLSCYLSHGMSYGMSACCSPYACLPVRYFLLILFSSRLFADIISGTGAGIFLCPLEYHYTVLYTRKDDSI